MGLKEFKISFNNPWRTFYPGDTVKGQLIIVLDSPKKCRGIKVKIKGEARTSWPVYLNNPQHLFTGHEEYILIKQQFPGGYSGRDVELAPGEYQYPFEFTLPVNIPSSFESDLGHVRYTIKGTIDRPWKFDHETKIAFTVVSKYDLNADPRASGSVMVEETKTFGCFCTSPPLTINFSLPARGYVSGQSIPINVYIENENVSAIKVYFVRLALEKHVTYRVTSPRPETRTKRMTIAESNKAIEDNNGIVIYEQLLRVPPLPPSNLNNCGIIDIQYILRLKAFINGSYNSNLKIATLIIIGTIPLVSSPCTPSSSGPPDYAAAVISSLVTPSYEESLFGAQNLQDEDESEHVMGIKEPFAPRYPFYNFPSTQ